MDGEQGGATVRGDHLLERRGEELEQPRRALAYLLGTVQVELVPIAALVDDPRRIAGGPELARHVGGVKIVDVVAAGTARQRAARAVRREQQQRRRAAADLDPARDDRRRRRRVLSLTLIHRVRGMRMPAVLAARSGAVIGT